MFDSLVNFYHNNSTAIFAGLFGLSEMLALIPVVKANSVFQAIFGFLKKKNSNV